MEKRTNITLYFVLLLCAGFSFLFFFLCNYWLVNEVLFEGMVPQTKITDPALKKIFRRLNMNSDLYLLVKRAHPSHGGYRIFIVAKLDTQFNWDVFHYEQFRESYSEAAKRVFESFKTNLGDSSPFQQVNPENIQRAYFIEPDFYRYPIDICDDVLYTLYILPGHEPAGLPVAIRLKD